MSKNSLWGIKAQFVQMEFIAFLIVVGIIGCILQAIFQSKEDAKRKRQELEAKARKKQRQDKIAKRRWLAQSSRQDKYGKLTKSISYTPQGRDIQVFGETETIFIEDRLYKFTDILSCRIETHVTKGKETHVTTPDKGQMYNMQAIYGTNWKKHITKYNTEIMKEADIFDYIVYIGINKLECPQIKISLRDKQEKANEIYSLLSIIIQNNKQCGS